MDFIMVLPLMALRKNAIRWIMDRLTKIAYFVAILDSWDIDELARIYGKMIARLHNVLIRHCLKPRPKVSSSVLDGPAESFWHKAAI